MLMTAFHLVRDGVAVGFGLVLENTRVAFRWLSSTPSLEVHPSLDSFDRIHCGPAHPTTSIVSCELSEVLDMLGLFEDLDFASEAIQKMRAANVFEPGFNALVDGW